VPVGLGTDATRVASYNPWTALSWMVNGTTVGGETIYPASNRLDRQTALGLITHGSAWMSREDDVKGRIVAGQYADFAALTADYFRVADAEIAQLASVLTVLGGRVVYGAEEFVSLMPELPPASPDWSPVRSNPTPATVSNRTAATKLLQRCTHHTHVSTPAPARPDRTGLQPLWGSVGCGCWAF
jgi:hypothetical protein